MTSIAYLLLVGSIYFEIELLVTILSVFGRLLYNPAVYIIVFGSFIANVYSYFKDKSKDNLKLLFISFISLVVLISALAFIIYLFASGSHSF
jgi:hypothetical protein